MAQMSETAKIESLAGGPPEKSCVCEDGAERCQSSCQAAM